MKLYDTRTRQKQDLLPLDGKTIRMYSCGPTVYDHIHIGNLSSFIFTDTLRRAIIASGLPVKHIMNITDIDDKTIRRSQQEFPEEAAEQALTQLTKAYTQIFFDDMNAVGNDCSAMSFPRATDHIHDIQTLIRELIEQDIAYIADDGVYFSIEKYQNNNTYGQLSKVTVSNTASSRIQNDEYSKDAVHDFALWKTQKGTEPSWDFELNGKSIAGRPGWHIECSAMSTATLGMPFDIHTGGIDLIFPHHENEIAQSTAAADTDTYANIFAHNEHILVDGKKMSKSLQNFFTLTDIKERGYNPIAFRLLVLQSHYRNQVHFSWDNLAAAQNRLLGYQALADLRFQAVQRERASKEADMFTKAADSLTDALQEDVNTPKALEKLSTLEAIISETLVGLADLDAFMILIERVDALLGLQLATSKDITNDQKKLIDERETARKEKDWAAADAIRDTLAAENIVLRDTQYGPVWYRTAR